MFWGLNRKIDKLAGDTAQRFEAQNERFDRKFDRVDQRFDRVDQRLDGLSVRIDLHIDRHAG